MATGSTVCGMYGLVSENCMSGILDISHINVDFMWGIHMWILSLYKGMCDMLDALKNFIWSMRESEGGGERERERVTKWTRHLLNLPHFVDIQQRELAPWSTTLPSCTKINLEIYSSF